MLCLTIELLLFALPKLLVRKPVGQLVSQSVHQSVSQSLTYSLTRPRAHARSITP